MVIDLEYKDDICVMRLKGRFGAGSDSQYLRKKADEVKAAAPKEVLADFTEVAYLDSIGIGFLIGIYTNLLKSSEGRFALLCPNDRVRAVLDLTKLTGVFPIFQDEPTALQALRAPGPTAEAAGKA